MMKKIMVICLFVVLLMTGNHVFAETFTSEDYNRLSETQAETERKWDSSEIEDNTLEAEIGGKEYTFYLVFAEIQETDYIMVDSPMDLVAVYRTYNPRGEALYQIEVYLDSNIEPGEYNNNEEYGNCKASVIFRENMNVKKGYWEDRYNTNSYTDKGAYCKLAVDFRNDDWTTYAGTFQARCMSFKLGGYYYTDVDGAFQFTLNEAYSFPEEENGQEGGKETVPDESETEAPERESEEKAEKTNSSSAACVSCEGRGYCDECSGLGECAFCFGEGEIACSTCGGSGTCQRCYGLGGEDHYSFATGEIEWIECSYCNGGGSCRKCGGSRYETCPVCYGTGSCRTCSGTGICSYCGGTGKNA